MGCANGVQVPGLGDWPVPPQEDQPISKDRIWIDGCFDFSHHGESETWNARCADGLMYAGHAGAMLQARRLGKELFVGIHSDEEILENKGPTVMTLQERSVALSRRTKIRYLMLIYI